MLESLPELAYSIDPVLFAIEQLGFQPDDWQRKVLRWRGKRLMLNCCRQSGKSTTTAIKALHYAVYETASLILLVSPSLRQSSELFRKVVGYLRQLDAHPPLVEDNRNSIQFENLSRIVSLPSNETTIRGFSGVNLIIEDEASRVADELRVALRPMLAVSGGGLILMSTPYGKRGHFYEEWTNGESDWERVMVKAIECPRISEEFLAEERRALGDHFFTQEYMCEFRDTTDQIFSSDLIRKALTREVKPLFEAESPPGSLDFATSARRETT